MNHVAPRDESDGAPDPDVEVFTSKPFTLDEKVMEALRAKKTAQDSYRSGLLAVENEGREVTKAAQAFDEYRKARDTRGTTEVEDMLTDALGSLIAALPDFDQSATDISASLHMGYDIEGQDENFTFSKPSDDEIAWLSAWLAGEGFVKKPRVP